MPGICRGRGRGRGPGRSILVRAGTGKIENAGAGPELEFFLLPGPGRDLFFFYCRGRAEIYFFYCRAGIFFSLPRRAGIGIFFVVAPSEALGGLCRGSIVAVVESAIFRVQIDQLPGHSKSRFIFF